MTLDLHTRAKRYLNIDLPVYDTILKSAFRRATRELRGGDAAIGGDKELFIAMKTTYDDILTAKLTISTSSDPLPTADDVLCTIDGTPLTELGLGLGPTTNGRDCTTCNGQGWERLMFISRYKCSTCFGEGLVSKCIDCAGTGTFTKGYRPVPCRRCHTSGVTPPTYFSKSYNCPSCQGRGTIESYDSKRPRFGRCSACAGKGETKIYNPVIIKGSMAPMTQSQRKRMEKMNAEKEVS